MAACEPDTEETVTERPLNLTKIGIIIVILGILNPVFWVPVLAGASADALRIGAAHSRIGIVIGLAVVLAGKMKRKT